MANEKRKRCANWMPSEKSLLIDLVTEHFHIIENKKTDGITMKQKSAEWILISNKYNSQTMLLHRTAENLKAQWESLKKSAKKDASARRMHLLRTGGGPARPDKEDPLNQKILSLISASAVGLFNPYDNDNNNTIEDQKHTNPMFVNVIESPEPDLGNKHAINCTAPPMVPVAIDESLLIQREVPLLAVPTPAKSSTHEITGNNNRAATNQEYIVDWGDYTPKTLKTPISKPLRQSTKENRRPINADKRLEWMSKRRPQLSTSSVEKLHQLKGNAIAIQLEHAQKEREEAKQLFNIQMDIQQEVLKHEKIKTKLLLFELRQIKNK